MSALIIGFSLSMAVMVYIVYSVINFDVDAKKH